MNSHARCRSRAAVRAQRGSLPLLGRYRSIQAAQTTRDERDNSRTESFGSHTDSALLTRRALEPSGAFSPERTLPRAAGGGRRARFHDLRETRPRTARATELWSNRPVSARVGNEAHSRRSTSARRRPALHRLPRTRRGTRRHQRCGDGRRSVLISTRRDCGSWSWSWSWPLERSQRAPCAPSSTWSSERASPPPWCTRSRRATRRQPPRTMELVFSYP